MSLHTAYPTTQHNFNIAMVPSTTSQFTPKSRTEQEDLFPLAHIFWQCEGKTCNTLLYNWSGVCARVMFKSSIDTTMFDWFEYMFYKRKTIANET